MHYAGFEEALDYKTVVFFMSHHAGPRRILHRITDFTSQKSSSLQIPDTEATSPSGYGKVIMQPI